MKVNRVWVKVCGLTDADEAAKIAKLGVDAVGVVFAAGSRRRVSVHQAAAIFAALPCHIQCVGVFVDAPQHEVLHIAAQTGIDTIQLHGHESPMVAAAYAAQGFRVIKAVQLSNNLVPKTLLTRYIDSGVHTLLLDTYVNGQPGGTGITGNWQLAQEVAQAYPLILAGGITPQNVGEALSTVQPLGIDVSSGVERSPGRKDLHKVAQLLSAVRKGERTNERYSKLLRSIT